MDESRTTVRDFVGLISFLIGAAIVGFALHIAAASVPGSRNEFEIVGGVFVVLIGIALSLLLLPR